MAKKIDLNLTGTAATGALTGLGGFLYDRYVKGNKNIKKNLLNALLFGGGGALAYAAYDVGTDILKRKGIIEDKPEEPERRDSLVLKGIGYGGAQTAGYAVGKKLSSKRVLEEVKAANESARVAANTSLRDYLKDRTILSAENVAELGRNLEKRVERNGRQITIAPKVKDLNAAIEKELNARIAADLKSGALPEAAAGGTVSIDVSGPGTVMAGRRYNNNMPKRVDLLTPVSGRGGRTRQYTVTVKAPGSVKTIKPSLKNKAKSIAYGLGGAYVGHILTSGLRNPEVRNDLLNGNFGDALARSDFSLNPFR